MKKKYSGYTLLEILVVLAIISILLYMLIGVMSSFKRTVELQQATDLIETKLNETKNYSANNILPDGEVINNKIYAYRLEISTNNINRSLCQKDAGHLSWSCAGSDQFLNLKHDNINITTDGCNNILLINLISDWQIGNDTSYTDTTCNIMISHKQESGTFRTFEFDGQNNNYSIKYGN